MAKQYDLNNVNSVFNSLPSWTRYSGNENRPLDTDFSILMHSVAQRFDSIWLIIDEIPKIGFSEYRDFIYAKSTVDYSANFSCLLGCSREYEKDINSMSSLDNFSIQNLMGKGFSIDEMLLC